jgi:Skp family chaperone for outer membrane proteins
MKRYAFIFFLAVAMLAVQSPAHADTKIATLNIQQIMHDSTAAQSVREQLDAKRKTFETEMSRKEEDLRKEDQTLSKQRSVLAQDAFEKKLKDFRDKAGAAQRDVQAKRTQLDTAFTKAVSEIQKNVTDIVTEMAKQRGFTVVIPTSQLVWADPSLDISQEVLAQLNKRLPKVKVQF